MNNGEEFVDARQRRDGALHHPEPEAGPGGDHLIARAETIDEAALDDIFTAAGEVAAPFDLADLGVVIVSSVTNPDGTGPEVAWQRSGGGSLSATSQIGTEGNGATLAVHFDVREGETAIIPEVDFDFEPFLSELIVTPRTLYTRAHHRPRLGTLEETKKAERTWRRDCGAADRRPLRRHCRPTGA